MVTQLDNIVPQAIDRTQGVSSRRGAMASLLTR
jgi:hypothetical protein